MELIDQPLHGHYKFKKEYCELLEHHMSKGYSLESFARKVGVDKKTVFNWCHAFPEFDEAKKRGTEASRYWLERELRRNIKTGKGSTISIIFALKNKFPNEWRDKKDLEVKTEEKHLTLEEQLAKVELMRNQLLQLKEAQLNDLVSVGE